MPRYWWDKPTLQPNMYIVRVKDDDDKRGYKPYIVVAMNANDAIEMVTDRGWQPVGKAEKVKRAAGEMPGVKGIVK